jgi:type III restriction enzyme
MAIGLAQANCDAMALHPELPRSPYEPLLPAQRWFPAPEAQRAVAYERLLPPLVARIREGVHAWRASGYAGASATSIALLRWWFESGHVQAQADGSSEPFRWYFAQREAVESVVWLYDVKKARDKFDLLRFDASGAVSHGMFPEDWPRYVVKMATGAGKTKVLSLLIAWSFFHRSYEAGSALARNFLLIAPNIIVLDRLRADFDGLRIFFRDPVLPDNGFAGQNWRDDFQIALHLQDDVRLGRPTGNLFLTNIHRVYLGQAREPSLEDDDSSDYFLGPFGARPTGKTTDSKADLGELIREIDELAVFNDEAHHIHDERMAWFGSIRDIHHRLLQKDRRLALQIDVTATPRHDNGSIFVQTVSDYPLVEAIHQRVVKHPVVPDQASRERLHERQTPVFHERYADYLALGVEEWRKSFEEHQRLGKKAVLFVMVDDTRNCDDVGAHLERIAPDLQGAVLVIHTKKNGEIAEAASGKDKEELERLRAQANQIDAWASPYKAIVSVLMLKEGWDVRNVTTIVGLRAYAAASNILPEQTLGRGLRRMYFGSETPETVSVMGTPAFMDFVESIRSEGVELDQVPMGPASRREDSLIIEIETGNPDKEPQQIDIALPLLSRRFVRQHRGLENLDASALPAARLPLQPFEPQARREIVFETMLDGETHHTLQLDGSGLGDGRSVVAFFARQLMKELRLVSGYEYLYAQIKRYVREFLFEGGAVDIDQAAVLYNLARSAASQRLLSVFRGAVNALTLHDAGACRIEGELRVSAMRPFRVEARPWLPARRSLQNRIVGEAGTGGLELRFARFLDEAPGVAAFAKNYFAVGFKLDYVRADGELSTYTPDFIVRAEDGRITLVETKGREELDLPRKMARLAQWCADATEASRAEGGPAYGLLYADQDTFDAHPPKTWAEALTIFREYQAALDPA